MTIDPTLRTLPYAADVEDTYLSSTTPTRNYGGAADLVTGTYSGTDYASLLRFVNLPILRTNDTITMASLRLVRNAAQAEPTKYIGVYGVKRIWSETGATWSNFDVGSSSNVDTSAADFVSSSSPSYLTFDITNVVRKWYTVDASGTSQNFGLCMKKPRYGTPGGNYQKVSSSDAGTTNCPLLFIDFMSHGGVESFWTYDTMSIGRSGTGHVDMWSGNLIWRHSTTAMTGLRMPVTVTHTYNSAYAHLNSFGCGYGFRTSWNQTVYLRSFGGVSHATWTDGDGTNHYFDLSGSAPYRDSEGLGLTYEAQSDDSIRIRDKSHTSMRFTLKGDRYYLLSVQDAQGNTATVTEYTGANNQLPKTITDATGRQTRFNYSSNYTLQSIITPGETEGSTRQISFTYASSQLTRITYVAENLYTQFAYVSSGGTSAYEGYAS